jgi:S-(hydroxymethyl)glutathione dehydrogenase/alcohol dehydrogenase
MTLREATRPPSGTTSYTPLVIRLAEVSSISLSLFAPGAQVAFQGSDFFLEKQIRGSALGSARIREDIPKLVELYLQGRLNLDDLVSQRIPLEAINEGFAAMSGGEVARSVVVFDGA